MDLWCVRVVLCCVVAWGFQVGEDGKVAPQLAHTFGSPHAVAPVLAPGGAALVPARFRTSVDATVVPAVPNGLVIQAVEAYSLRAVHEEAGAASEALGEVVFVLVPRPGGPLDAGYGDDDAAPASTKKTTPQQPQDAVEAIRLHLRSLQKALDPTRQAEPLDSPGQTWQSLAEDSLLAEEHFGRAFSYTQKTPLDGLLQKGRMNLQREILNIWQLSVSTNQNLRVASFWHVFQLIYKRHIEDVCFPVQELTDEAGAGPEEEDEDGGEENNDEEHRRDVVEEVTLVDNPGDTTSVELIPRRTTIVPTPASLAKEATSFTPVKAKALTEQERNERRYLVHRFVDAKAWVKFRKEAKKQVLKLLELFALEGRSRLMGDFLVEPANLQLQKQRGVAFLNLVLYDNDDLSGAAVKMLYRHFNRRIELSSRLINSTLVLEEQDKDTLKFVAKRRVALSRCMQKFANPYSGGAVASKDPGKSAKTTRARLKNLAELVCILVNDPEQRPGPLGLVNLCWTPLWDAFDNSGDGDAGDASAAATVAPGARLSGSSRSLSSNGGEGESKDGGNAVPAAPTQVLTAAERVMALAGYGPHPLVRGLPREEKVEEMNQQMLGEQGIHETVLLFLKKVLSSVRSQDEFDTKLCDEQKEVVKSCLVFLFYFCYGHARNSDLLSTPGHLEVLLNLLPWWGGSEVAVLLAEVLVDNDKANKMVEETHVRAFGEPTQSGCGCALALGVRC